MWVRDSWAFRPFIWASKLPQVARNQKNVNSSFPLRNNTMTMTSHKCRPYKRLLELQFICHFTTNHHGSSLSMHPWTMVYGSVQPPTPSPCRHHPFTHFTIKTIWNVGCSHPGNCNNSLSFHLSNHFIFTLCEILRNPVGTRRSLGLNSHSFFFGKLFRTSLA